MRINTAKYTDKNNKTILVNDSMFVPFDEGNRHYKMIQDWIAEGNTPSLYVAPVKDYMQLRQEAYAPIPDQLDMMYWDKVKGTTTWQDHVASVKAAHPKS